MAVEVVVVEEVEAGPAGRLQVHCQPGCQADHLALYLTPLHLGRSRKSDTRPHLVLFSRMDSVHWTDCPVSEQPMSTLFEV